MRHFKIQIRYSSHKKYFTDRGEAVGYIPFASLELEGFKPAWELCALLTCTGDLHVITKKVIPVMKTIYNPSKCHAYCIE